MLRLEMILRNRKLWKTADRAICLKQSKKPLWLLSHNRILPPHSVFFIAFNDFHALNNSLISDRPLLNYNDNDFRSSRIFEQSKRNMGLLIPRIIKGVLKLRYLLLGCALTGGYSLQQTYRKWVDSLPSMPDLSWVDKYKPSTEAWKILRKSLVSLKDRLQFMEIEASDIISNAITVSALSFSKVDSDGKNTQKEDGPGSRITEEDIWEIEMKYQQEIERLERENKELRQQILLRNLSNQTTKKVKISLIDMYSDVLDELTDYDVNYKTQDHLPRVVVIGDQSSGKTSVLEMIAQARIFPRGAGEMMTRAPVKVTLSEGPYHIAQFKGSSREFDLTKESDLADLRREVELKMRNLTVGKTVSTDVISMTVKGPGLQRMVLVDLPGIISTNTLNMAEDTKEAIYNIVKYYMSNPNAIILCVQDGSIDAERSNVTELVSQIDPSGKRTIFVLTKIDLAEENFANPDRIRKILSGELFPMKALGYFAVITGRGPSNESIQQIKEYEEKFFRQSKLFNSKTIKSSQITTRNLSKAVSECFWKMVQETVEQQADAFKAQRFNLETEWKNKFPRMRMLDRNELFEKARSEILDEVINLNEVSVKHWEDTLVNKLWSKVSDYVFEDIYLAAAQSQINGEFNTRVDIQLFQWAEQQLPQISVEAGWETLQEEFRKLIKDNKMHIDRDEIFDNLKTAVLDEVLRRHKWEEKASDVLRVLQLNTLTDQIITDKLQWESAVRFLESSIKQKMKVSEDKLKEYFGPSTLVQWTQWKSVSEEQQRRRAVKYELEKIIFNDPDHRAILSDDELTTVRNTLQRCNVACSNEFINNTWTPLYRWYFLKRILEKIPNYMKGFYLYRQGIDAQEYNEVVLYWRLQQMLRVTVNSLRQQIVNREAPRIDGEIEEVLDEFSHDQYKKEKLLTGRRVTLAEELKRVKQIQEKLEEFIKALNKEKQDVRRIQ